MPKALLVYPEFPPSYWGLTHALKFIGKKALMPPLGLLTVASMFPPEWEIRVVDTNVHPLTDDDLAWADLVCISAMVVQKKSMNEVTRRCREIGVPVAAGGPYPTSYVDEIEGVDYLVLDEVEDTFLDFLIAFENGTAAHVTRAPIKLDARGVPTRVAPDIRHTPLPRYDLINLDDYGCMALQFSRGCPFDCEFCDITKLFGRIPRTKSNEQVVAELDLLYHLGWRGSVFMVDDNFIGNKKEAMRVLPAIAEWQIMRGYPYSLFTEASVNLVEVDGLIDAMVNSGFEMVFLGIETPNPEALLTTKKGQNVKKGEDNYLLRAVRTIQAKGMEVSAGFILGLDGDTESAFDSQIDFIQEAGIPMAIVNILTALKGTDLYHRLEREGRLRGDSTTNSMDMMLNFVPELDPQVLAKGFKRVIDTLYDPWLKNYFDRCLTLYDHIGYTHRPRPSGLDRHFTWSMVRHFLRHIFSRKWFVLLAFIAKTAWRHPQMMGDAAVHVAQGIHFREITRQTIAADVFRERLRRYYEELVAMVSGESGEEMRARVRIRAEEMMLSAMAEYKRMRRKVGHGIEDVFQAFMSSVRPYANNM